MGVTKTISIRLNTPIFMIKTYNYFMHNYSNIVYVCGISQKAKSNCSWHMHGLSFCAV